MASRSGGDAPPQTMKWWASLSLDSHRRIVQICLGGACEEQDAVTQAFEKVLRQGRKPHRLQRDLGKEFYNAPFRRMLKREGIQHFSTHGDAKAYVVERFNRTLNERMYRYFTARTYLNVLPQLLNGYNQTRHRSIATAPRDVTDDNERVVWTKLYGKRFKRRRGPNSRWAIVCV